MTAISVMDQRHISREPTHDLPRMLVKVACIMFSVEAIIMFMLSGWDLNWHVINESHDNVRAGEFLMPANRQVNRFLDRGGNEGQGFSPLAAKSTGLGLTGMRARVQALGGRLDLQSVPGSGTTVTAIFAIKSPAATLRVAAS